MTLGASYAKGREGAAVSDLPAIAFGATGAAPDPKRWLRRHAGMLIRAVLSIGLLYWLFRHAHFAPKIRIVLPWLLGVVAAILFLQPLAVSARWLIILRGTRCGISYGVLSRIVFISIFFNQFLPSSVGGDAIRVYYGRKLGIELGTMIASVVLDRAFALFAILGMVWFSVSVLVTGSSEQWALRGLGWLAGGAVLGFVALVVAARFIDRAINGMPQLKRLKGISGAWVELVYHPTRLATCVALSVGIHAASCATVLLTAAAMGIILPPFGGAAASLLIIFAQNLPISIGGWGVREWTATATLAGLGISPDAALAVGLTVGLAILVTALPGSILWIGVNRGQRLPLRAAGLP